MIKYEDYGARDTASREVLGALLDKYFPEDEDVAEDTGDNKFDAMMSKVTSKKSLNAREALGLMDELIYQGGASYEEALEQASMSFEIDPATLDQMYQQQAGSLEEAESKPVDMKRWLRDFDRREDKNFHTENVIAIAKLVGSPEDIKLANEIKKDHMARGGLSGETYEKRQALYKKLWPLVQQKIEASQSLDEEGACWKNYKQIGMKPGKNGKPVPDCRGPIKETKSNILKGLM